MVILTVCLSGGDHWRMALRKPQSSSMTSSSFSANIEYGFFSASFAFYVLFLSVLVLLEIAVVFFSFCCFLAHLSRRLMGELIVYQSVRRPSFFCRPLVRPQFQTSSPLKPHGQSNSNFIWRLLRTRERKFVQTVLVT